MSMSPISEIQQPLSDYHKGIVRAEELNKPIFLFFTSRTCENPILTNNLIENDKDLTRKISESYIPLILYVDDKTNLPKEINVERDGKIMTLRTKGDEWAHIEMSKYNSNVQPYMVIINSKEEMLKAPLIGRATKDEILEYLK